MKIESTELEMAHLAEMIVWALAKDRENRSQENEAERRAYYQAQYQVTKEEISRLEERSLMREAAEAEQKWNRWYRKLARRFGWPTHE